MDQAHSSTILSDPHTGHLKTLAIIVFNVTWTVYRKEEMDERTGMGMEESGEELVRGRGSLEAEGIGRGIGCEGNGGVRLEEGKGV